MFLSVAYIAYFFTSNATNSEPNSDTLLAEKNQESENNESVENSEDNDTSDNSNNENSDEEITPNSETEPTDEATTSPTDSENENTNSENENEFMKEGIVISPVFTHPVPETDSSTLSTLQTDDKVNIVAETGGWYKLDDNSYVYSGFIKIVN
jgi:hypothetical protein